MGLGMGFVFSFFCLFCTYFLSLLEFEFWIWIGHMGLGLWLVERNWILVLFFQFCVFFVFLSFWYFICFFEFEFWILDFEFWIRYIGLGYSWWGESGFFIFNMFVFFVILFLLL